MKHSNEHKRKKLAFLIDCFIVGGVERVLIQTMSFLEKQYDITLIILSKWIDDKMIKAIPANVDIIFAGGVPVNSKCCSLFHLLEI